MHLRPLSLLMTTILPRRSTFARAFSLLHRRRCAFTCIERLSIPNCEMSYLSPSTAPSLRHFATQPHQTRLRHESTSSNHEEWTEYEQLVRKLYMVNMFNPVKLGLENMERLHEAMGRPMDQVGANFAIDLSSAFFVHLLLMNTHLQIS